MIQGVVRQYVGNLTCIFCHANENLLVRQLGNYEASTEFKTRAIEIHFIELELEG
jgi:hypothetical protein